VVLYLEGNDIELVLLPYSFVPQGFSEEGDDASAVFDFS
jgi:hypothetical protein